jgi:hypothetical protein
MLQDAITYYELPIAADSPILGAIVAAGRAQNLSHALFVEVQNILARLCVRVGHELEGVLSWVVVHPNELRDDWYFYDFDDVDDYELYSLVRPRLWAQADAGERASMRFFERQLLIEARSGLLRRMHGA